MTPMLSVGGLNVKALIAVVASDDTVMLASAGQHTLGASLSRMVTENEQDPALPALSCAVQVTVV